jgi:hypothetical protein
MSVEPASSTRGQAAAERSRRAWPEAAQFNEAVQNLASSLVDRELQAGQPELGPLGMPMPYAGNFADVYKVHCPATGNTWAVKFFKREVRDLRERYRAISEHLAAAQLPFMVDFHYQEEGVRIGREAFPLVKMRWVEGQTLNRFVAQSLAQPKLLDQLYALWIKLAARLRTAGIAHADLQHGNVVLVQGEQGRLLLKLIDYDGMFVPALAGQQSGELGHANFQHPQRDATRAYHAELDRFSHLTICTALRCLAVGGMPLWERFNNDENLLFTARDFRDPAKSTLFRELWTLRNPEARSLVGQLALATQRPLEETPLLNQLVRDGQVRPLTDLERRHVEGLLHGAPVVQETPAAVPLLIPLMRPTTNEPLVACPRCYGQVSLPAQASSEMQVRCPLCGGEYFLSEAFYLPASAWAAAANPTPPPVGLEPLDLSTDPLQPRSQTPPRPAARGFVHRLASPMLWIDRRLRSMAGDGNVLLHNFFRVVAAVVILVVVPWLLGRAAGSMPSIFSTKEQQFAQMEEARRSAYQAAGAAHAVPPQLRDAQVLLQGQNLLNEGNRAAAEQRFADARQAFDQATERFKSSSSQNGANVQALASMFQTAIAREDAAAAASYLAQIEQLRTPNLPVESWRRQLESLQRKQAQTKGSIFTAQGKGSNNVYAGSTRPGFPKLPDGCGPMDDNPQTSFNIAASGMKYRMLRKGNGKPARAGQLVKYHALAWLDDGSVIANHNTYSPNRPTNMHLVPGNFAPLVEGLQLVRAGGMIELEVPATAYANSFPGPGVPPGATMHFVVELLEVFN